MNFIKNSLKYIINYIGYDIRRINQFPRHTFLGIKKYPVKTIIDIGSHLGEFARELLTVFPSAQVFCFEPQPNIFMQLNDWATNSHGQIIAFNYALGDKEFDTQMIVHTDHTTSSSLLPATEAINELCPSSRNKSVIPMKVTTLDLCLKDFDNILHPDIFIKIDVQGFEEKVIQGGLRLFSLAKICMVEINLDNLYEGQPSFSDIFIKLHGLGYRYVGNFEQICATDGHVCYFDAIFIKD